MDQRLQLQQKMSQRLIMTPQMQQSIQLLQLSTLELTELLQEEMTENPLLEEEDSVEQAASQEEEAPVTEEGTADPDLTEKGIIELDDHWEDYFTDSSDLGYVSSGTSYGGGEEEEEIQTQLAMEESLKDHLVWQLRISTNSETEYHIGEYLIDNLNEDGYLQVTVQDVAEFFDTTPEEVEQVLKILQGFDPPGVGARNLAECLEIQCRNIEIDDDDILEVIRHHLEELERKRYKEIARALGVTEKHVQEIADIIGMLDPRPARQYNPSSTEYILPDVFVEKVDGKWQVRINDDGAPPLRISKKYRDMLHNRDGLTNEEDEFIKQT